MNSTVKEVKLVEKPRIVDCELTDEDLVKVVGGLFKPGVSTSGTVICLRRGRRR
jgi:hypothetical protein